METDSVPTGRGKSWKDLQNGDNHCAEKFCSCNVILLAVFTVGQTVVKYV